MRSTHIPKAFAFPNKCASTYAVNGSTASRSLTCNVSSYSCTNAYSDSYTCYNCSTNATFTASCCGTPHSSCPRGMVFVFLLIVCSARNPFFILFAVDLQLINSFAVRPSNFYCSPTDRRNIGSCCTNYQTRCNSCSPDSRGTPFSINPTGNSGSPCFQSAIGCPINYMVATTPGPTAGQNCYFCFGASFSPSFSLSFILV